MTELKHDPIKLFNETIPQLLLDHPEKVKTFKGTFQINITGAGSWFLDPVSEPPTCTPGTNNAADAVLSISAADWQKLAADPKKAAAGLIMFGKLKITNMTLVMASATKLGELFNG